MRVLKKFKGKQGQDVWRQPLIKNWLLGTSGYENFTMDARDDSEGEVTEEVLEKGSSGLLMRVQSSTLWTDNIDKEDLRLFVGTWNVAGKVPPEDIELEDWLDMKAPADIYVIGFQEIVPLNVGNVLGNEDCSPSDQWVTLLRKNLNTELSSNNYKSYSFPRYSSREKTDCNVADLDCTVEDGVTMPNISYSVASSNDQTVLDDSFCSDQFPVNIDAVANCPLFPTASVEGQTKKNQPSYIRVASKQMVGIFISVWIRRELRHHVSGVRVSCVPCGIMGRLGNKGSISISLSIHQTSFCFICCHLASGEKERDELRRNSDVAEILKRTLFRRSAKFPGRKLPENILAHDRIIWFGDLNYRLSLSVENVKSLIQTRNWQALLERDQLKREQRAGRAFVGWREGSISFAPTYKYMNNSDLYSGMYAKQSKERRAPAWCDRILWYGKGLKELDYIRSESRFSDHRPVKAVFEAEVEKFRPCSYAKPALKSESFHVLPLLGQIVTCQVLEPGHVRQPKAGATQRRARKSSTVHSTVEL
eukprot:c28091_g1_i2 orf=478-2079(+)